MKASSENIGIWLNSLTDTAKRLNCLDIANVVIKNKKFQVWTGAGKPSQHHYGKYGLIVHTTEVIELCLQTNEYFQNIEKGCDPKAVFLAALYHDIGKTRDYEPLDDTMEIWTGQTKHRRQIYHITRSAIEWMKACEKHNMDEETQEDVLHAIVAHHGQREWGSSTAPNTQLAWLLHLCDSLSARMDDCDRIEVKDNPAVTAIKEKG